MFIQIAFMQAVFCTLETASLYNLLEMSKIARAEEEQVLVMEVNNYTKSRILLQKDHVDTTKTARCAQQKRAEKQPCSFVKLAHESLGPPRRVFEKVPCYGELQGITRFC